MLRGIYNRQWHLACSQPNGNHYPNILLYFHTNGNNHTNSNHHPYPHHYSNSYGDPHTNDHTDPNHHIHSDHLTYPNGDFTLNLFELRSSKHQTRNGYRDPRD